MTNKLRLLPHLAVLAVLVCSLSVARAQGLPASYPPLAGNAALEQALLTYTNLARAQHGVAPLEPDEQLALAARHHAADMARLNYLSHDSPNPETATLARRVARAGLAAQTLGENIASLSGATDLARRAVDGWMASPGHRANLLSPDFSHVGFGAATDSRGVTYLVQDFAYRPLALEEAELRPYTAQAFDVELTLDLTAPQQVAVFVGDESGEPVNLGAGRQTLRLTVTGSEQVHLSVGVKAGGASFILQDEGWLNLRTGQFDPSSSASRSTLVIRDARVTPKVSQLYQVELSFDASPRAPLAVWLNGDQLRSATLSGSTLLFDLPRGTGPQVIDLGLQAQGSRYQVIMSLALDTSLGVARLVPHAR